MKEEEDFCYINIPGRDTIALQYKSKNKNIVVEWFTEQEKKRYPYSPQLKNVLSDYLKQELLNDDGTPIIVRKISNKKYKK